MDKNQDIIKKLQVFKQILNLNMPISKMIFFGSRAKGTAKSKWSDVDLIMVSKKFKEIISYKRARGFRNYWNLDYPVDFLCYTPEEFNKLKNQITIVREAVREGIEIK